MAQELKVGDRVQDLITYMDEDEPGLGVVVEVCGSGFIGVKWDRDSGCYVGADMLHQNQVKKITEPTNRYNLIFFTDYNGESKSEVVSRDTFNKLQKA
jgi:hypothetical protein